MVNEISKVTSYQVTTKYYNGKYKTKEDAERIDKLMTSLERVIDFACEKNYLRNPFEIVFLYISTKNCTCDFVINGIITDTDPHYYTIDKESFISELLILFAICKIKSFDWTDRDAKKMLKRFNDIVDDIIKAFPEKAVVIERIKKLDNVYDANGDIVVK